MYKLFLILLTMLCMVTFMSTEVYAKRFGGGRSFGVSRSIGSLSSGKSFASNSMRPNMNRWMGPLTGMLVGGLLASLFMHNGVGTGMMAWIALAAIGFFIFNLLRNRAQQLEPTKNYNFQPANNINYQNNINATNFDTNDFLRDAKVQFLRMQTAYDQKNLNDIRAFTTPEVFGEIQLQLQEMGENENVTEVPLLNAELLHLSGQEASVRFHGMVREKIGEEATLLNETWHFQQNRAGKWLVAGIQQNSV